MDVREKLLWWCGALLFFVVLLFFVAPHRVDGYYLSHTAQTSGVACVYAHWTWHADELAFCTNNYQEALEFVARANATVR